MEEYGPLIAMAESQGPDRSSCLVQDYTKSGTAGGSDSGSIPQLGCLLEINMRLPETNWPQFPDSIQDFFVQFNRNENVFRSGYGS